MPQQPGRFITFEGGEGAGKSTQVRRLAERLRKLGIEVVLTREPGGSPRGEQIRAYLLSGTGKSFGSFAETLLFAAARADHVDRTIAPALARGASVICDRFVDSTRVYQGDLGQVPDGLLRAFERVATGRTRPDLTIILDVPAKLGLARAQQRRESSGEETDRFEAEGLAFHSRIRDAFLAIAAHDTERYAVIDAGSPPETVERMIWAEVEARLLGQLASDDTRGRHGG